MEPLQPRNLAQMMAGVKRTLVDNLTEQFAPLRRDIGAFEAKIAQLRGAVEAIKGDLTLPRAWGVSGRKGEGGFGEHGRSVGWMLVLTAGITACLSLFECMNRVLNVIRTVAIGGPPMTVSSTVSKHAEAQRARTSIPGSIQFVWL